MANITNTPIVTGNFFFRIVDAIGSAFTSFGMALVEMGATQARIHQIEKLSEQTDEELAAQGLRREDIVRHVFRDHFHV